MRHSDGSLFLTPFPSPPQKKGLELPFEKDDNHDRADGIDPYSEIFNSANILGGTPEAEEGMANAKVYLDEGIDPDMFKDSK